MTAWCWALHAEAPATLPLQHEWHLVWRSWASGLHHDAEAWRTSAMWQVHKLCKPWSIPPNGSICLQIFVAVQDWESPALSRITFQEHWKSMVWDRNIFQVGKKGSHPSEFWHAFSYGLIEPAAKTTSWPRPHSVQRAQGVGDDVAFERQTRECVRGHQCKQDQVGPIGLLESGLLLVTLYPSQPFAQFISVYFKTFKMGYPKGHHVEKRNSSRQPAGDEWRDTGTPTLIVERSLNLYSEDFRFMYTCSKSHNHKCCDADCTQPYLL